MRSLRLIGYARIQAQLVTILTRRISLFKLFPDGHEVLRRCGIQRMNEKGPSRWDEGFGQCAGIESHKDAVYDWDSPSPSPAHESTEVELAPHRDLGLIYLNASNCSYTHFKKKTENGNSAQVTAGKEEVQHK